MTLFSLFTSSPYNIMCGSALQFLYPIFRDVWRRNLFRFCPPFYKQKKLPSLIPYTLTIIISLENPWKNNVRKPNPLLEHSKPTKPSSKSSSRHREDPLQVRANRSLQAGANETCIQGHKSDGHGADSRAWEAGCDGECGHFGLSLWEVWQYTEILFWDQCGGEGLY